MPPPSRRPDIPRTVLLVVIAIIGVLVRAVPADGEAANTVSSGGGNALSDPLAIPPLKTGWPAQNAWSQAFSITMRPPVEFGEARAGHHPGGVDAFFAGGRAL